MQRVPHDHPTVTTVRATLARSGGTTRPRIDIPADHRDRFPVGETVRVVLDGSTYHARIERAIEGDGLRITGVFDNARLARTPGEGTNRLIEWYREHDVVFGRSVLIDVVVPAFTYGIREPGETATYDATEPPANSLREIAGDLDDE